MGNPKIPKRPDDEQLFSSNEATEPEAPRLDQDETVAKLHEIIKQHLSQLPEKPDPQQSLEQVLMEIQSKIHDLIMSSDLTPGNVNCMEMVLDTPDHLEYRGMIVDLLAGFIMEKGSVFEDQASQLSENPNLKKTPEQLFNETIRPKIHDVVMALGLAPVIEKCRLILVNSNNSNRARHEKTVAKMLMQALKTKNIPFKKWAFFPEVMIGEKAANCSGAALVFGVIMNEEFGIKTDYANPMGHAATVVTFSDGKTYYFDPRNQESQKIELRAPRTRDGFDIYKTRVLDFGLLPVSKFEHGAMLTILENMRALKDEQGKDPEADLTAQRYDSNLDFDFAEQYMKGNFLSNRSDEDEWKAEKANIRYNRMLFDNFHLIPNH